MSLINTMKRLAVTGAKVETANKVRRAAEKCAPENLAEGYVMFGAGLVGIATAGAVGAGVIATTSAGLVGMFTGMAGLGVYHHIRDNK